MLLRFLLLLTSCVSFIFYCPAFASDIRVNLGKFSHPVLRGTDLYAEEQSVNNRELKIGCSEANNSSPVIQSGDGKIFSSPAIFESHTGFIFLNNKSYRGKIIIYAEKEECIVVNSVDTEKYIAGLINKEMLSSWPLEALKAQAVASRTYAFYQKEQNKNKIYDVENSTQDQVYDGADSETPKSNTAAESTRGTILSWRGRPIKAFYHANCGGQTESPEAVWGYNYGYFKPVICPFHQKPENQNRWSLNIRMDVLERTLKKISGVLPRNFSRVAAVEAGALDGSHRRDSVVISDISGNTTKIPANTFRNLVGNTKIKSTDFNIHKNGSGLFFSGNGNGHGVGMCQVGVKVMATQGKKFNAILKYYYPLAKLTKLK